ncbi:hypothetical protein G7046_g2159 [Stylonectria norvegica]|nr:hypothetical protein G7046_g2159 [Stylonectria norvegica]
MSSTEAFDIEVKPSCRLKEVANGLQVVEALPEALRDSVLDRVRRLEALIAKDITFDSSPRLKKNDRSEVLPAYYSMSLGPGIEFSSAVNNCSAATGGSRSILSSPDDSFTDDSDMCLVGSEPFAILPIEGKGLGMVATTRINRGTRILAETPLIYIEGDDPTKLCKEHPNVSVQFNRLDDRDREHVLSLCRCAAQEEKQGALHAIIWTNAIPLRNMKAKCSGLFITSSRINHSCNPNALHFWDSKFRAFNTIATRVIEEGEEITTTYISGFAEHEERQKHLKRLFGFTCTCWLCELPLDERNASDIRIKKINQVRDKIHRFSSDLMPVPAMKYIRELLDLYAAESIVDYHPRDLYLIAERLACSRQDSVRRSIFAKRRAALTEELGDGITGLTEFEERRLEALGQEDLAAWGVESDENVSLDRPVAEGDEFESWLFMEEHWESVESRFPSIHTLVASADGESISGEEEWELVSGITESMGQVMI